MLPPQRLYESLPSQKVSVPHPADDTLLLPLKIGCCGITAGEGKFLDRGEVGHTDPGPKQRSGLAVRFRPVRKRPGDGGEVDVYAQYLFHGNCLSLPVKCH